MKTNIKLKPDSFEHHLVEAAKSKEYYTEFVFNQEFDRLSVTAFMEIKGQPHSWKRNFFQDEINHFSSGYHIFAKRIIESVEFENKVQ